MSDYVVISTTQELTKISVQQVAPNVIVASAPQVTRIIQVSSGSGGGPSEWGLITGTLSDQTDLQSALDAKQDDLGFTPENVANKATDLTSPDNTKYPTTLAVSTAIGAIPPVNDATTLIKGIVQLAGDLTGTAALPTIGLNKVTNAKAAQMPANTIKGNNTVALADSLDLTATETTAMLNNFVGENGTVAGTKGLVPAPAVLDGQTKRKFIRADGSWSSQTKEIANRGEALTAISGFVQRNTTANQWFGLVECPDFGTFISVASSGTNRILRSLDAITWQNIATPANNIWTKMAYSPELRRVVAVSFDGVSRGMYSDDGGATWTLMSPGAATWYDIAWSPKNRRFVAVNLTGGTGGAYSSDGVTWTNITFPGGSTTNFFSVCWSDDQEKYVVVRLNGGTFSSSDGVTWVANATIGVDKSWSSICYGKGVGRFVAVGITGAGTSRISYSENGETWVTGSIPSAAWRRVVYGEEMGMYLAVASGGQIAYSFDGATFTSGTAPEATNQWYDVIWSKYAGAFIISGITGTSRIMTSRITKNWVTNQKNRFVINGSTTAFTLSLIQANTTWRKTDSTNITVTVPENASVPFLIGTRIKFVNAGTAIMTFAVSGAAVIQSRGGFLTVSTQHGVAELEKVDVNTWVLSGEIS